MNLAILGCGGMGNVHAAMATNAGCKVTVCADVLPKAASALAKKYGARPETPMEKALDRGDVDAVCIASPTPTHLDLIKKAAATGKHIFCEKPFCRTLAECDAAIAAAEKAGVHIFVGHVVRYFHEFEAMKAQVAAGKIGQVGFAKLYRGGMFPGAKNSWFRDYEQSGGVTLDSMIHDLDWIRYVFGEPERIFCQTLMREKSPQVDYSQVTMRMASGMIANVIGTWAHPSGFRVKTELCGSGGIIQFDSTNTSISAQKRQTAAGPSMIVPMSAEAVSPYELEWHDFLGLVRDGAAPRVTPHDGRRAVEMALAALKSAKTGKPVNL